MYSIDQLYHLGFLTATVTKGSGALQEPYLGSVGKDLVIFDPAKVRMLLRSAIAFFSVYSRSWSPILLVERKRMRLQKLLSKLNFIVRSWKWTLFHKCPGGIISNFYCVTRRFINLTASLGLERSFKRRVSCLFPRVRPSLLLLGSIRGYQFVLEEANRYMIPVMALLDGGLNFRNAFVMYPVMGLARRSYTRMSLYALTVMSISKLLGR